MFLDEDKILKMFKIVNGDVEDRFSINIIQDDNPNKTIIELRKDGQLCWSMSLTELLFEYVTKDWL